MMDETIKSAATLANSIVGVTVLAMPYCFAQCGFLLATTLLVLVSLATIKSSGMLLACALATKRGSYEFLAHQVYGPAGKLLTEVSMIGLSFGTLVAFHIIVGDLCPQVVSAMLSYEDAGVSENRLRTYSMVIFAVFVILPLSLMRDPSSLSKISFVSLAFYGTFLLHLTIMAISSKLTLEFNWQLRNPYEPPYNWFRLRGILYSLPIMSLAFSCQTQLFLLYDSLPDPDINTVHRILKISVFSSCTFYVLVGSIGYATFNATFPSIMGDLTAMYPSTMACNAVRLLLVLSVAVSFPVIIYPCRVSVFSMLYLRGSGNSQEPLTVCGSGEGALIPDVKFKVITVALVMSTLASGILIPDVAFVLGITGALTGSVICYILPAGFFLATFRASGRTAAIAILLVGLLVLCVSSFVVLAQRGAGHPEAARAPPPQQPRLAPGAKDVAASGRFVLPGMNSNANHGGRSKSQRLLADYVGAYPT